MKNIWFFCFCVSIFYNCENATSKSLNPLALISEDTEIIIKVNSAESLANGLKNNALINALDNYTQIKDFKTLLTPFNSIKANTGIICLSKHKEDSLTISFIIPFSKEQITLDSISGVTIDTSFSNAKNINKLIIQNNVFYCTIIDSTLFMSNKLQLTLNAQSQKVVNPEIETLFNTGDKEKMVSILINHKNSKLNPQLFRDATRHALKFSDYSILDAEVSQNAILFNGVTIAKDSSNSLINLFKNTIPQENKIAAILPTNVTHFKSLTFNDYDIIKQNLIRHQLQDSVTTNFDVLQTIIEVGYVNTKDQEALIWRSIDPTATLEHLNATATNEQYRDVNLYPIDDANLFLHAFAPIITLTAAKQYINLGDFFIFSNDRSYLETIISNYQNSTVLSESNYYQELNQDLSDESSLLIYGNSFALNDLLNINFNDDKRLDISNYKSSAIQYIYDSNFAHVNAVFKTNKNQRTRNSIREQFNISLDTELLSAPQLVKNHRNNEMDIVAQDVSNNLYLISNKGKVFWKKQLDGKILGKVKQIDTYKNGRLQLVFNTSKRLYIIDRNGKDVNPFPLKFNDDITQPVSVFDYDKKKNYRLLITQGKSVLMYDKTGKIVRGFKYKSAKNNIITQPKHFRIGRKDHIVFAHGNQIEILDRVGKTRIKVKENISFSDNEIYLYKNKFTTSNTNGELLEINQNGRVSHKNLNANSDHKIATTSKTLVVLKDNKLTIKSNTYELNFGNYTAPKIFYINDKIYVTVTDLQSKKGYLFDSQAKPIGNFPVYATSELELDNIDKDKALEVITKSDNNAIIVYEIL